MKGPLYFVAILFGISATLRVGLYADSAVALVEGRLQNQTSGAQLQACEPSYDLDAVLSEFKKRDANLSEREANLAQSEVAIRVMKQEIKTQLASLSQAEDRLNQLVAHSQSAAKDDLQKLSEVYSAMNPKQAAALFETMDAEFAAGFLSMLDPFVAAEILAGVSPERAYALSVIVAGRNTNAPTE